MNVATIILQQLGGNKFNAMTGAKNHFADGNALQFKLPSNFAKDKINFVKIRLMPDDTYQMEFSNITMKRYVPTVKQIKIIDNVYCDQLQTIFTEVTGLDTHL